MSCGQRMNYSFSISGLCGANNKDEIALDENEIVSIPNQFIQNHKNVV